jgi:hypothetical protein
MKISLFFGWSIWSGEPGHFRPESGGHFHPVALVSLFRFGVVTFTGFYNPYSSWERGLSEYSNKLIN